MKFHHIGIATKNIAKTLDWVSMNFEIISVSDEIFDKNQNAFVQMIETNGMNIELVSGEVVEKFIEKKITYYHVCYEVSDIDKSILRFEKSIVISKPKEALLFNNRRVAFLMTPIGIIELLECENVSNR